MAVKTQEFEGQLVSMQTYCLEYAKKRMNDPLQDKWLEGPEIRSIRIEKQGKVFAKEKEDKFVVLSNGTHEVTNHIGFGLDDRPEYKQTIPQREKVRSV